MCGNIKQVEKQHKTVTIFSKLSCLHGLLYMKNTCYWFNLMCFMVYFIKFKYISEHKNKLPILFNKSNRA